MSSRVKRRSHHEDAQGGAAPVDAGGEGTHRKGPRREFRALTSAGQRHDTEWAEKDLQGGAPAGAHCVKL